LILLDLMMPAMDGRTFMAERARDPSLVKIPVVVLSAAAHQAAHLDAVACYRKPVEPEALMALVAQHCLA
jgi:CheY-like chemotaxis protein